MTEPTVTPSLLDAAIQRLEAHPHEARIIADTLHLVRGLSRSASTRDAPRLARLACAVEALLQQIDQGDLPSSAILITLVLVTLDRLRQIVADLQVIGIEALGDDRTLHELLRLAVLGQLEDKRSARSEFGLSRAA